MGSPQHHSHGREHRDSWIAGPEEAVHLLRLLPQQHSQRGHPLVLYLEPCLVRTCPLPPHSCHLGSSSTYQQLSTYWRHSCQHPPGYHPHLCHHLCPDGPRGWRYRCSPDALPEQVDLDPCLCWKPNQRVPSLATCSRVPPRDVDCTVYWSWSFEGRAPALLDSLDQAFITAPLFVILEILCFLGY